MIYLLHGDNDFTKHEKLAILTEGKEVERHDGAELTVNNLREVLRAQTLFGGERTIVVAHLSEVTEAWAMLPELADGLDGELLLLEDKVDKRTKTYKWLAKHAQTLEFPALSERQRPELVQWCVTRAKQRGYSLKAQQAQALIDRLGYDQLRLDGVLVQLALAGTVTDEVIDTLVPLPKTESVFELFEAALAGNRQAVHKIVAYLEMAGGDDGAYQTLGLLVSQLVNLNALVLAGGDAVAVASDFGVHPFALRKLVPYARQVSSSQLSEMNRLFGEADMQMKTTSVKPWLLVEMALIAVTEVVHG